VKSIAVARSLLIAARNCAEQSENSTLPEALDEGDGVADEDDGVTDPVAEAVTLGPGLLERVHPATPSSVRAMTAASRAGRSCRVNTRRGYRPPEGRMDDIEKAKRRYRDTLGLRVSEDNGLLTLQLAGGRDTLIYPKPDHAGHLRWFV
jgi:hypothetical protein